ncbi:peroxiredoxin family protein [Luteolibacter algae]|uniref:Peroxiredoxin family protein n=1 Tax=Luteolibacter algae TaxID=454151 RepID=A0ABW5D405_9BACT
MLKPLFALLALFALSPLHASPAEAERIQRSFELTADTWALKYKLATSEEEKQALLASQPDRSIAAAELWRNTVPSLKEEWSIPFAAYFLDLTDNLTITDANENVQQAFSAERQRVIDSFAQNHLNKPGIAPFCIALADTGNPQALSILEKIAAQNPDEATQGVAALGAAMIMKTLGDEPEVMKKRLGYLRKAIIQSSDQKVADRSIADIVSDELYVIRYLSKGRIAPDFTGTDVAGRTVKLSDSRGKITVLLFWDASTQDTDKIIQLTNRLVEKHADNPVKVLGITPESLARIRELQADGSIKWDNIIDPAETLSKNYKIAIRPAVFIINAEGKIEYTGLPGSFVDLTLDALLSGN